MASQPIISSSDGVADSNAMQGLIAAAHELTTPLTVISHIASALGDGSLDAQDDKAWLEYMQLSADRTLRLISSLTTTYNLGNQLQLDLEPINIAQVCEEVAHEIFPFAAVQHQTLEIDLGQRAQLVVGDRELLHTILFNVLDNALRGTPPQTVVRMSQRRQLENVRIDVHDNGPALRPSDISKLEQRLGGHMRPLGARGSGGLGLYIAQQLAEAMGGSIGVGRAATGARLHLDLLHSQQLRLV